MKKLFAIGLASLIVASSSLTAEAHHGGYQVCGISGCRMGECFMDFDGDGICGDHNFVDANGDGICDNHYYYDGNGDNICDYFIDNNGDGICDHCHNHGKPIVRNTVRRSRSYYGSHHGCW